MKTNEYLYGESIDVAPVPEEIIMRRVEILEEHLDELLSVHYTERDGMRCTAVINAIKFWRELNYEN